MSSTFVTRLKVGEILIDAKGVSRLASRQAASGPLRVPRRSRSPALSRHRRSRSGISSSAPQPAARGHSSERFCAGRPAASCSPPACRRLGVHRGAVSPVATGGPGSPVSSPIGAGFAPGARWKVIDGPRATLFVGRRTTRDDAARPTRSSRPSASPGTSCRRRSSTPRSRSTSRYRTGLSRTAGHRLRRAAARSRAAPSDASTTSCRPRRRPARPLTA